MSKDMQIEEIDELTSVLYEANHKKSVLDYHWLATEAYNAGYRKQSEDATDINVGNKSEWISVEERLPEPEKEVLILAIRRYMYMGEVREVPTITTAMYEDGTMSTEDSEWNWHDIDFVYDEENDVQYIPEGWWEYRHYNPDDVYNNAVDDKVTHWMPLPEAPKMEDGE